MIKLNNEQLKRLSEFTANLGVVQFATIITPFFTGTGNLNLLMIMSSLILMMGFLLTSLFLER